MNFGGLERQDSEYAGSEIVVLPVPFNGTSTWIKGADRGPAAILDASANMELYDIETDSEVYRKGIHTDLPMKVDENPEIMAGQVEKRVSYWLDQHKMVATLGGEHSVSLGPIRAHLHKYPEMSR